MSEEKEGLLEEVYLVRVQLIRSDSEGEYISRSFDYEVSPSTEPYQEAQFLRAERFYKQIQGLFSQAGGRVTVTDKEKLRDNK